MIGGNLPGSWGIAHEWSLSQGDYVLRVSAGDRRQRVFDPESGEVRRGYCWVSVSLWIERPDISWNPDIFFWRWDDQVRTFVFAFVRIWSWYKGRPLRILGLRIGRARRAA